MQLQQFCARYGLGGAWADAIRKAVRDSRDQRHRYPWDGLESLLSDRGGGALNLVGYGSLMHPVSAARSIEGTPAAGHAPVVAFGGRRVYDYVIPESALAVYGELSGPGDRAALNVHPSGDPEDMFNGRLIPFAIGDLERLRDRETAYNLEPVAVVPWDRLEAAPTLAFALSCPVQPWEGQVFVNANLTPAEAYHQLCLRGARMVSQEFAELFLATTYMGDGETLVSGRLP